MVLSSKRCPHTGLINFYARGEPFIAVGSVLETSAPACFQWRCYVGREAAAGTAADFSTAERYLLQHYREIARLENDGAATAGRPVGRNRGVSAVR